MEVDCPLEGLRVRRQLRLDRRNAVFAIEETVPSIAPLGRLYNMVQHPTLAAPFLDDTVVIRCNATQGFTQFEYEMTEQDRSEEGRVGKAGVRKGRSRWCTYH